LKQHAVYKSTIVRHSTAKSFTRSFFVSSSVDRELLHFVVDVLRQRVLTGPHGGVGSDFYTRHKGRRMLGKDGGFLAPSAAYLALTKVEGNPYFGRDDVLALALDAGDRLVLDHAEIGRTQKKPNHFTLFPLAELYELAAGHAGKKRLGAWRDTMARNLKAVHALIDRTGNTLGKPGPWAGTGPNHFFGWFAVGLHQALLLGDDASAARIRRAMLRHIRIQSPAGYFPEHEGPVVQYHGVSLGGVAEFHRLSPGTTTRRALQRGVEYLVNSVYPDLRCIETYDERNRYGSDPGFQPALAWTAQGRRLLSKIVALHSRHLLGTGVALFHPKFNALWTLGAAFRCYEHAADPRVGDVSKTLPLPFEKTQYAWRLEKNKALVRKSGPWFHVLSAYTQDTPSGNPYHFERSQALSVYHDSSGLIIGGGNDKRAPQSATIHVVEEREVHYFPPLQIELFPGAGRNGSDRLRLDYGSTQVNLRVRAESARRLRISADAVSNMINHTVTLVLQLPLKAPVKLLSDGKPLRLRPVKEGDETQETPLGKALELPGKWRMKLPRGSTLAWPHFPWNSYRPPTYRVAAQQAIPLLRVPLRAPTWKTDMLILAGI
jgi:hypothetical protein